MSTSNQKKILFIEPASHYEVLRSYVLMFHSFGYDTSIMTSSKNHLNLSAVLPSECRYFNINEDVEINSFLISKQNEINQYDIVVLTTEEDRNCNLIEKNWAAKTYVLIHHFNTVFDYKKNLRLFEHYLDPLKFLKYILQKRYKRRVDAVKSFDGYIFPYEIDKNDQGKIFKKPYVTLPFLFNEFVSKTNSPPKTIVVPGTVVESSREYHQLYDAIGRLNELLDDVIDLVLLGNGTKKSSKLIIEKFKKITGNKIKLISFDTEVDQGLYDKYMQEADLLLLPLKPNLTHNLVNSIGGRYSLSGSIGDMVRFGKKALIFEGYIVHSFLEEHCIRFNTNNLVEKITSLFEITVIGKSKYFTNETIEYFKYEIQKLVYE